MPTTHRPFRLLRKFVWWLTLFVSVNVAFYIVIPLVAANYIKRHLEGQGFFDVEVDLGYPGPRKTHMPYLTVQKNLPDEHLSLTIRNLEISYELTELLQGHLRDIAIERISLELTALPPTLQPVVPPSPQPSSVDPTVPQRGTTSMDSSAETFSKDSDPTSLVSLARLLPALPFESFSLGQVSIFRASATGPFRRMEMSGSIENREGTLKGVMTFRGEKVIPYSLLISLKPSGDISVVLRSNKLLSAPLLMLDSRIESSLQTGIAMQGSLNADLKQLTPFLALFMPLGSDLHKVDGHFHVDWNGTTSHDVTIQTLFQDPATTLTGAFHLDLQLPAWAGIAQDISMTMTGQMSGLPQEVKVNITTPTRATARVHSTALPVSSELTALLGDSEELFVIEVNDRLTTTLSYREDLFAWAVEGFLQAQYGTDLSPLGIQVALKRASGDGDQLRETEGHLRTWGAVKDVPKAWAEVEKLEWDIHGNITSTDQHVEVVVASDSFVSAEDLQNGSFGIPTSSIQLREPWRFLYDNQTREWKADLLSLPLGLSRIVWGETETFFQKTFLHITQFRGDPTSWILNGKVILAGIEAKGKSLAWPVSNCGIGFWVEPQGITLGARLETLDKSVSAQLRLNHQFQSEDGNLFATVTPQPFSRSRHRLSHMLIPWSFPFDVTSGEMSARASIVWAADNTFPDEGPRITRGELTLSARNVGGSYHDVTVQDMNATLEVLGTGLDNMGMPIPAAVTVGSVHHGITVRDLSFSLQLGFGGNSLIPTFDLKDFSGRVFDGTVSSPRIYFNTTQPANAFVLKLEGLKLDKILQLERQPHLEGTGVLNGFVPVTLHGGDVEIHDGKVEAQPPGGLIRYRPLEESVKKLAQNNFNMDVVLHALANFHYDVLAVGVQYIPQGTLQLHAQLEGKNPDLNHAQPIHFNLNIEENIPSLLQSLRVAKDMERQIGNLSQKILP